MLLVNLTSGAGLVAAMLIFALASVSNDTPHNESVSEMSRDRWQVLYVNDFSEAEAMDHFVFSDPDAWRYEEIQGDGAMTLHKQSDYTPPHRSPRNIALLSGRRFGDFDLELEVMQTGREYGHRDMCIYFGFQDAENYYYAHVASKGDQVSHMIHIVHGAPRKPLKTQRSEGVDWGKDVWRKVRLERRVKQGTIKVYFGNPGDTKQDMGQPVLVAKDATLGEGLIGIGSFDDTGAVRRIKVTGATMREVESPHPFAK